MKPFVSAIILAAGNSSRMNSEISKQFIMLNDKPLLANTLINFELCNSVSSIIVVCRKIDKANVLDLISKFHITKVKDIAIGGNSRQQSVFNALEMLDSKTEYIAIHDGARPYITPEQITLVISDAIKFNCAAPSVPVKDTIKVADENLFIVDTPNRSDLFAVQTPQVFERNLYMKASEKAKAQNKDFTDDCQLLENININVKLSKGSYSNIKITTVEDLPKESYSMLKIGHGYDVHRLTENRKLIIGGVDIPYEKGLLGHSDADVLIHAIMDALLGAASLPNIGSLFPDNDPMYSGADSIELLKQVCIKLANMGFSISNIDSTIIAQEPKLQPFLYSMRKNIAATSLISLEQINIKATTEEGLGFSGSKLGIAAHAVCLLNKV